MVTTNLGAFCRHRNLPPLLFALAFRNKMQCRFMYACIHSGRKASTSCKNLVRFGSVTPVFKKLDAVQPASIILLRLVQLRLLGGEYVSDCGDQ